MPRPIRTLLFSTLFPSTVRPVHGIFVETRLRELLKTGKVETKVVAPVPWFPFSASRFGEYGQFAATPHFEQRNGIDVFHPRYFLPPKVGMTVAPHTLALGALPTIKKLIRDGFDFDLIDAHYYYPDGVAAGIIAKKLGKPFVVTARGTDLNLIPAYKYPRQSILRTAQNAAASIGVSTALMVTLENLGAEKKKLNVFRNGVDLEHFHPIDQITARAKLGWPNSTTLISVGNLVENKGHHLVLEASSKFSDVHLVIVGAGPEENTLRKLAQTLGVSNRVTFSGRVSQEWLPTYYSAANILLLASSREGWPNVLLESMACGTPVIATQEGGIPEIVRSESVGTLVSERTIDAFVTAVTNILSKEIDRAVVRNYAEKFDWSETTNNQINLFSKIIN